jgi:hypothetical protein
MAGTTSARRWIGWWRTCGRVRAGTRPARRGRGRQDRVVGIPAGARVRLPYRASGGSRIRDGAPVRRVASALRTDAASSGTSAGPAGRCARRGVRAARGGRPRSVPGRPGRPQPPVRRRRGGPTGVRGGRRPVARPGLGAGARLRDPPSGSGVGCRGLRGARVRRRTGPDGPTGAPGPWAGRPRRAGAPCVGDHRPAGRAGARPDRRRDPRQPAGALGRGGRWIPCWRGWRPAPASPWAPPMAAPAPTCPWRT